ncbi:MAG TPA: hypothetical protein VLS25_08570 [Dehalococcoidia bacterium]|nr:hypothetical protein [Dehalococcoidia bacterium]
MMQGEMDMLERDLVLLSGAVRYPATPDVAKAVTGRLAARRPQRFVAPAWRFAGAAVAAVVAVALLVAVIAPAREAVADLFDRIDIFRTEGVPPGITYEIKGRGVTLEEARAAVGSPLALPEGRQPSRVLLQEFMKVKAAVLFFEPDGGPGYALFETNAIVGKGIPVGEPDAEPVAGLGGEAFWLTGLHIVQYENDRGDVFYQSQRATDQNTLIWAREGHVFRIEGPVEEGAAVEIAEGLR